MRRCEDKTKVMVLGSTGMAGHVVTACLEANPSLAVSNYSRSRFNERTITIDATDHELLEKAVAELLPDVIVNCVGVLIREAEKDTKRAIEVNSLLPYHLVSLCDRYGGRLVHLSTDCVFSGRNGPYGTMDFRDGDSAYDRTKALGEVVNERDVTIRTSITGPELKINGTGLFHWFMSQRGNVTGYPRAMWSGVMTTELAKYIEHVIISSSTPNGLVHFSVPGGISKLDLLRMFQDEFARDVVISSVDGANADKRLIPSEDLGFVPKDYRSQIASMHEWMNQHPEWYSHYQ